MLPPKLDYLFIAYFRDGTRIHQDQRDASREHPLTRSAFWDVLQEVERGNPLERFTLTDGRSVHTVHLSDGHFDTNGTTLSSPYGQLTNYRIVYFRRVERSMEGTCPSSEVSSYFLGWQANDANGKNEQMTLEIKPDVLHQPTIQLK